MKEKTEKIVFISLNVIYALSAPITFGLVLLMLKYRDYFNIGKDYTGVDLVPVGLLASTLFSFFIFKIISFPLFYYMRKQFPYIYNFLKTLRLDKKYRNKILFRVFSIDTILAIIYIIVVNFYNQSFHDVQSVLVAYIYFIILMGFSLPYLTFFLFFHPVKSHNIGEDGSIIIEQSNFLKKVTKIFLVISIFILLLLIFLTILCTCT